MPFTFCHPAIVLPFRYLRNVSMTGLVAGSMIPDFEYFLRMQVRSEYSHTLSGIFWFDLPLGLIVVFVYQLVVKDKLIDNLPIVLNRRFLKCKAVSPKVYSPRYLIMVALCILTGTISHILWDGFTHPTGYFVSRMPELAGTVNIFHHSIFVYKILQHASSLVGAIVIVIYIYHLPVGSYYKANNIMNYWGGVLAVIVLTLIIKLLYSYHGLGEVIVTAIAGLLLGLIIISLFFKSYNVDSLNK